MKSPRATRPGILHAGICAGGMRQRISLPRSKDDGGSSTGDGEGAGKNPDVDFRGTKRTNETHASTTDRDARLYRKSMASEAKLGYLGHVLTENRSGLVSDACLTLATGTAEREAAIAMIARIPGSKHLTLGADKGYDTADFVAQLGSR